MDGRQNRIIMMLTTDKPSALRSPPFVYFHPTLSFHMLMRSSNKGGTYRWDGSKAGSNRH
jgi:hypothetical protein